MKLFTSSEAMPLTRQQRQAYDLLLSMEIERVEFDKHQTVYLQALKHISSFWRPVYATSMSDRDMLIHYYLKPEEKLFSDSSHPTEISQETLKNQIKKRTYKEYGRDYRDSIVKTGIFGVGFLIGGGVLMPVFWPIAIAMLVLGIILLTVCCMEKRTVSRDTSSYIETIAPRMA